MTWLARAVLDKDELAEARIWDRYGWHKAVWECFPRMQGRKRNFLTRVDEIGGGRRVFILGASRPERPRWCPADKWDLKTVSEGFLGHSRYRFDLVAVPSACGKPSIDEDGKFAGRGKKRFLYRESERLKWLSRKAEAGGFCVDDEIPVLVDSVNDGMFVRKGKTNSLAGARFRGVLDVTDRGLFARAFHDGIGRGKAFGYGMLLLQPLN